MKPLSPCRSILRALALSSLLASSLTLGACATPRGTIGAVISQQADGRLFLHEVPPDLAAGKAGLRAGDEILTIDGRDARAMSTAEVHQALSGEVGDRVKLTLLRKEEVIRVTLARTEARKLAGSAGR